MPDDTQHVSLGDKKCKKMLGCFFPPDAFDKYLTWSTSEALCSNSCVITWQTLELPYISEVMLGGDDPTSLS